MSKVSLGTVIWIGFGAVLFAVGLQMIPKWSGDSRPWTVWETLIAYCIFIVLPLLDKYLDRAASLFARRLTSQESASVNAEQAYRRRQRFWMACGGVGIHAAYRFGPAFIVLLGARLPLLWFQAAMAGTVLVAGWAAHYFKRKNQRIYGAVEIMFGIASACKVAGGLDPKGVLLTQWLVLVGISYIVARGFGNWREGVAISANSTATGASTSSWVSAK